MRSNSSPWQSASEQESARAVEFPENVNPSVRQHDVQHDSSKLPSFRLYPASPVCTNETRNPPSRVTLQDFAEFTIVIHYEQVRPELLRRLTATSVVFALRVSYRP